jgi:hypothetical protein
MTWIAEAVIAAVAGAVFGGLAALLIVRRRDASPAEPRSQVRVDPDLEDRINAAARSWADAYERPGAERLAADKLRLGLELQDRRRSRRSRRSQ